MTPPADSDEDEYTVEIQAKVRYTEKAPTEEIAEHNAEQDFIFDVDANLDDIEILELQAVADEPTDQSEQSK